MKHILIVLVMIAVLGAAGFVGTMMVVQHSQNAEPAPAEKVKASMAGVTAMDNLTNRQTYGMIGAGVGAGVGLVVGVLITMKMDGKRKSE